MSTSTDQAQIETPPDPIERLNDFSDRLSPIVVKEMRQGLRQASFVILFLFLQSVLAMVVISGLVAVSDGSASARNETGNMISGSFFGLFMLAALVIQPLRGLNALSTEIKDSTIDLLLLTRLNAWRIVFGKWMSLMTQSSLLLVAIIPYLMMRYFLGGMNLVGELMGILFVFLFGATATAGAVGMSAIRSVILRGILAAAGIVLFIILIQSPFSVFRLMMGGPMGGPMGGMGPSFTSPGEWVPLLIGLLLLLTFLTHAFLEFGATRIAAPSENRSARKRIIALVSVLLIPTVFSISDIDTNLLGYLAIAIILPLVLTDTLSESPGYISSGRRKELWLLRPGWPSGALFGLIFVGLAFAWMIVTFNINHSSVPSTYSHSYPSSYVHSFNSETAIRMIQAVAVLAMIFSQPLLIVALFRPTDKEPATAYLIAILASTCLGVVVLAVSSSMRDGEFLLSTLFCIFPIVGFGSIEEADKTLITVMALVSLIYLGAGALLGRYRWGHSMLYPTTLAAEAPAVAATEATTSPENPETPASEKEET